jgi:hypothetical protein
VVCCRFAWGVVDGGDEVTSRVRSVRLPDSLWEQLQVLASARGVSVSTVIVWALTAFIADGYVGKGVEKWEKR